MPNNEFGDFQTPQALALQCLRVLDMPPDSRVLEPTCGTGAFLEAAAQLCPGSERVGLERNADYVEKASRWGRVSQTNIFEHQLNDEVAWRTTGPLVVVGNPPWVTSAELNRMDSHNLPPKENFKGAKGLDAMLGGSNFDVCEYVILKMLNEHRNQPFKLGMLCKTQVARNVVEYAASSRLPLVMAAAYRIDAMKWFNAGVDACWFVVTMDPTKGADYTAAVHDDVFDPGKKPATRFGVVDGLMVSDVDRYESVRAGDGSCPYIWRSGLKHDSSSVFELVATPTPATKSGIPLDLEPDYVLPFLKSTDIFRGREGELSKWVIVPQKTFGAETSALEHLAPKLWRYLVDHAEVLDGRKSSIYRNRPRFSVFGHGPYTYAPYKVAISGLHKEPVFRLVAPMNGQPVVLDDTCYLLPFDDATEAALVTAILNSAECRALIESMVFWDSKRPITKKLLARLDLNRVPFDRDVVREQAAKCAAVAGVAFDDDRVDVILDDLGAVPQEESLF